jgi:hypothetical protein
MVAISGVTAYKPPINFRGVHVQPHVNTGGPSDIDRRMNLSNIKPRMVVVSATQDSVISALVSTENNPIIEKWARSGVVIGIRESPRRCGNGSHAYDSATFGPRCSAIRHTATIGRLHVCARLFQ